MSYSFREPEWPIVCECKYDEARDLMDRDDCAFHCAVDDGAKADVTLTRKSSLCAGNANQSAA
jgi:hypothetical protein